MSGHSSNSVELCNSDKVKSSKRCSEGALQDVVNTNLIKNWSNEENDEKCEGHTDTLEHRLGMGKDGVCGYLQEVGEI